MYTSKIDLYIYTHACTHTYVHRTAQTHALFLTIFLCVFEGSNEESLIEENYFT